MPHELGDKLVAYLVVYMTLYRVGYATGFRQNSTRLGTLQHLIYYKFATQVGCGIAILSQPLAWVDVERLAAELLRGDQFSGEDVTRCLTSVRGGPLQVRSKEGRGAFSRRSKFHLWR